MKKFAILTAGLILVSLTGFSACKKSPEATAEKFAKAMCGKVDTCMKGFMKPGECMKKYKEEKKKKNKKVTPEMAANMEKCMSAIKGTDCKNFMKVISKDPACKGI